jgi:uncharacterized phage protein gp47/JayE
MPGPYGVTPTGYNPKSLQEIITDLQSAWRTIFGNGIDVSADSPDGLIIGIFADRLADLWQADQATYNAAFPDTSTGVGLDRVMALTGAVRLPATKSLVAVVLSGVAATAIPSGSRASVAGAGTLFETTGALVIGGGGTVAATLRAVEFGPMYAPAGTLTVIETPVAGWTGVTNAADQSFLGSNVETDPPARVRRELTLRAIGAAAADAIRAGLLQLAGVTSASVFENETDFIVDSMPPRSFECVVVGGSNPLIAQTIWDRKPSGIPSFGNTFDTATDSETVPHTIYFSRPVALNVWVTVNVDVNSDAPENVGDLIKAAVVAWGDLNLRPGGSLVAQALVPTVFDQAGVVDCDVPLIGLAVSPGASTTLNTTPRQLLDLDTARVVVNVTRI